MTGPDSLMSFLLSAFTLAGVLIFVLILIRTFNPAARTKMDADARIPFRMEEDRDGQA